MQVEGLFKQRFEPLHRQLRCHLGLLDMRNPHRSRRWHQRRVEFFDGGNADRIAGSSALSKWSKWSQFAVQSSNMALLPGCMYHRMSLYHMAMRADRLMLGTVTKYVKSVTKLTMVTIMS